MALNEAPLASMLDEHALMNLRGELPHLLTSTTYAATLFAGQLHMHVYALKIDSVPTTARPSLVPWPKYSGHGEEVTLRKALHKVLIVIKLSGVSHRLKAGILSEYRPSYAY